MLEHVSDSLAALHDAIATGWVSLDVFAHAPVSPADDLVTTLRIRAGRLLAASAAGGEDRPVAIAGRRLTGCQVTAVGAVEITVHGWDIAEACRCPRPIPPALATSILAIIPLVVTHVTRNVQSLAQYLPHRRPVPATVSSLCLAATPKEASFAGELTVGSVISTSSLLGYALASFVLIVIPGPSVLFVVGRALAYGRRTALATVCGNSAGNYVVAICVAVGVGALVQRSAQVFTVLKLAGALYLIWLGIQALRRRGTLAEAFAESTQARSDRRAVREGFLVGVTNPKALILFGAVLPQFVNRAAGHVPVQMLVLSLVSIVIGLASDSTWGVVASQLRSWFARSPRRFALVGGAGGLAMIGVGVTVALTGRKN